MGRPALEVADIFRAHGPAWRQAQHGHLSLGQLKVMSAIEQCRSAALGGHVLRCQECAEIEIAYNSCLMGSCFEWGVDASSEREPCRPRSCNSPLKLVPKHGDDLVRRPERSPAQFRRNDCVEYLKLLGRVGASIDFGSSQIAMT